MPLKADLIVNPFSGGFNKEIIDKVHYILKEKFTFINLIYTNYAKHAEKLASESKADIIFIAGGDGLINEVINGIVNRQCIIYPLAFGTANVFCREYNIPVNPVKAAKKIDANDIYNIPLGKINDRIFVKMVGFGFDAAVVNNINYYLKKINSKFAHILSGMQVLVKGNFKQFDLYVKSNKIHAYSLIISLGRKYAGNFNLVKQFFYNGFTICVINNPKRTAILKNTFSILLNKGVLGDVYLSDTIKVEGPTYCQIDGEYFGLTNSRCNIDHIKSSFFLASYSKYN